MFLCTNIFNFPKLLYFDYRFLWDNNVFLCGSLKLLKFLYFSCYFWCDNDFFNSFLCKNMKFHVLHVIFCFYSYWDRFKFFNFILCISYLFKYFPTKLDDFLDFLVLEGEGGAFTFSTISAKVSQFEIFLSTCKVSFLNHHFISLKYQPLEIGGWISTYQKGYFHVVYV